MTQGEARSIEREGRVLPCPGEWKPCKVFYWTGDRGEETCELGCKHSVSYYEVKRLTITHYVEEWEPSLHYDKGGGYGKTRVAVDAQGREYRSHETWDGYDAFVREGDLDRAYFIRPLIHTDVMRDTLGNQLDWKGERI